jgi:predicted Zn finger-like uncharacterized protein
MNVSCPQCSTVYRVDPAKVPQGGVRARCSTCGGVIPVGITMTPARPQASIDAMQEAFSRQAPQQPGPFVAGRPKTQTPPASPRVTPISNPRTTPPSTPRVATPSSNARLGASLPPLRPTPKAPEPAVVATPPRPASRVPTPPSPAPPVAEAAPVSVPPVTPAPPPVATAPEPPAVAAPVAAAPGARRPINPFLARDPSLRAKRLARALVSDMVAYYPAKHAEGLEKGTLKELFRDEIKKSYEEYVAQVGSEFARSTTHFQESLNEVLGAGRKIF